MEWCSHVFYTDRWEGEIGESEEMRPMWVSAEQPPYDKMWGDDQYVAN